MLTLVKIWFFKTQSHIQCIVIFTCCTVSKSAFFFFRVALQRSLIISMCATYIHNHSEWCEHKYCLVILPFFNCMFMFLHFMWRLLSWNGISNMNRYLRLWCWLSCLIFCLKFLNQKCWYFWGWHPDHCFIVNQRSNLKHIVYIHNYIYCVVIAHNYVLYTKGCNYNLLQVYKLQLHTYITAIQGKISEEENFGKFVLIYQFFPYSNRK